MNINKIKEILSTRLGFIGLLVITLWIKTIVAYLFEFNLGVDGALQYFILFINPIASSILLLSIALYARNTKRFYLIAMLIYALTSILLFSNIAYYREFTDFITINTILGAGKIMSGLGESTLRLLKPQDILYLVDLVIIPWLLVSRRIKPDENAVRGRFSIATSVFAVMLFGLNLTLAEISRPELLTRTFSRDYLVKYLGLNSFMMYDGVQTYKSSQVRAEASENDIVEVEQYTNEHHAKPNESTFGIAKGKNVIYIHLESLQQFVIDYKLKDENGVDHEVTPFINSLFHDKATYSFDNFFHQVKAGKTSDAETLMDNSLFGLNQGALFTQLGGKNSFQSAPTILKDAGYTSAVFHGNAGTFWNRNETYKHFGYDYFFDSSYYDVTEDNSFQYGLHDKPFMEQSQKYLNELNAQGQPFMAKMIAVSNHYPYAEITGNEFPMANTEDETINGYFATANYLDKSIEEFFNYLKESGIYHNSMIVLYGDHYGISNSRNKELSSLLGKDKTTWTGLDNASLQRVPYMIHIPGETNGFISHEFGGQVDSLPTVLHLLGINTDDKLLLGQDLLSKDRDGVVAFRDGDFMSKEFTYYGGVTYDNMSKLPIVEFNESQESKFKEQKKRASSQLSVSDKINSGDLFRFFTTSGLVSPDPTTINFKANALELMN